MQIDFHDCMWVEEVKFGSFILIYKAITLTRLETVVLTRYCRRVWCAMLCFGRILTAPFALCGEAPDGFI